MKIMDENFIIDNRKIEDLLEQWHKVKELSTYELQRLFVEITNTKYYIPVYLNESDKIGIRTVEVSKEHMKVIPIYTSKKLINKDMIKDKMAVINYIEVLQLLTKDISLQGAIINIGNNGLLLDNKRIQAINQELLYLQDTLKIDENNINFLSVCKRFIKQKDNIDNYINELEKVKFLIPIKLKKETVFAFVEDSEEYCIFKQKDGEFYFPIYTSYLEFTKRYGTEKLVKPLLLNMNEVQQLVLGFNQTCGGVVINPEKEDLIFPRDYLISLYVK